MAFSTFPRAAAAGGLAVGLALTGAAPAWADGGGGSPPTTGTPTTGTPTTGTPTGAPPAGAGAAEKEPAPTGGGDSCDAACMQQVRAALQEAEQMLQLVNTALASAPAVTSPPTTGTPPATGGTGGGGSVPPPDPAGPPAASGGTTPTGGAAPTGGGGVGGASPDADVQQVLALTNTDRSQHGCGPVTLDPAASKVAADYAGSMLTGKYFSHTSPAGQTAAQRAIAAGSTGAWGENIAEGQPTAAAVMTAWQASPGHQANIVNCAFTTVGVGEATGAGGPVWVQMFSDKTGTATPGGGTSGGVPTGPASPASPAALGAPAGG